MSRLVAEYSRRYSARESGGVEELGGIYEGEGCEGICECPESTIDGHNHSRYFSMGSELSDIAPVLDERRLKLMSGQLAPLIDRLGRALADLSPQLIARANPTLIRPPLPPTNHQEEEKKDLQGHDQRNADIRPLAPNFPLNSNVIHILYYIYIYI